MEPTAYKAPGRYGSYMIVGDDEMTQTALLLPVLAAERVVSTHRRELDLAAADGIPSHVTVAFPFKPLEEMDAEDHARLAHIGRQHGPFRIEGRRTAWFEDRVLYVEVSAAREVHALIVDVASNFPAYPPFSGDIPLADVVPHLTVGNAAPVSALRTAARAVDGALPFSEVVQSMELWAGPSVDGRTQPAPWTRVRSYTLGSTASTPYRSMPLSHQ